MRFVPILGFLLLVVALLLLLVARPPANTNVGDNVRPLPPLTLSPMKSGVAWDQKALVGHVTVLNFFASWCAPCAAEMPDLVALHQQFPAVRIEGVVWNDDPATLGPWVKKNGHPFHALWLDTNGAATIALGIKGIPETLIVDGQGRVRYRLAAPLTDSLRMEVIAPLLRALLMEASHAP